MKHIAANWLDSGDSSLPAARRASSGAPLLRYGIATQQTARLNVRWHFGCQVGLLNSASHRTVQSGSCHCGKRQSLAKPARRTVVGGVLVQASMRTRRCVAFFSRASLPFHPSACTSMHANTERSPVCHRDYLPVPFCPSGRHSPILSGPTSSGEWLPRERLV